MKDVLTVIYKNEKKKILYKDYNPKYIPYKNDLISLESNNSLYYVYDITFLVPNTIIITIIAQQPIIPIT